jgi:hypothetical protein
MIVNKNYCMSSYLMFRTIIDKKYTFKAGISPKPDKIIKCRLPISNSAELEKYLKKSIEEATAAGKAALALSGGIDSAILAKFMPKGSVAYTFKCIVPGIEVTDETHAAARYAEECGLEHRIIEIYWSDFEKYAPVLMSKKGAPIHSIEVQIYKAALQAKKDGFSKLIFGESADCLYGGLNDLLSRDWKVGEFVDKYSFVKPYMVLKEPILITEPFLRYEKDGYIDVHKFISNVFFVESIHSYFNACDSASVDFISPYMKTYLSTPLDIERVRRGENKYLVREIFDRLYSGFSITEKIPMPRPMNEWLKNWDGPKGTEFIQNCTADMTGDQKWMVYCLEMFLNMIDDATYSNYLNEGM